MSVLDPYREALGEVEDAPVRLAYAATRVVLLESYATTGHSAERRGSPAEIAEHLDWDTMAAQRRRLDGLGFGVAEAMDTAQRFEIGWENARALIEHCGRLELAHGFVAGAGLDGVADDAAQRTKVDAVVHQARTIQDGGGHAVLLPFAFLARTRACEDEYVRFYDAVIGELEGPLFVHWLGEMFLAELDGYFPGTSFERVMALDPSKVRGAKISLLDPQREIALRSTLRANEQIVLTGDDFHFGRLVRGGERGRPLPRVEGSVAVGDQRVADGDFSHALLGVLDAVAEPMGLALQFLARGDFDHYDALASPCEELGRALFAAPTQDYKAGLAFLAWVNGLQANRYLVNGAERARGVAQLLQIAQLARRAGAIVDSDSARARLAQVEARSGS